MEFEGLGLQAAADRVIQDELTAMGGDGGIVALTPLVAIYGDEE